MTKVKHITHKKSDVANKAPKVGDLANGEIAVNYAKDSERLYIKNTSGEIIPFSSDHIITDSVIDAVLASKTSARGYDTSNPTLANLYGSKESLNSVLKHYKMGLFKDGALVKECAPCRITKAVDGSDIKIDGSKGDIMIYTDTPIYRDRCRVSGVTVPNSTATTHNVIGLGLIPHQVDGKEAKKMNPFAFTPSYVQLNRDEDRYYSCYNPSYSGNGLGKYDTYGVSLFTTNFIGENGAQGGYPVMGQSAIDSMKRSRAKGTKYQGIFYEFYEMWLIAMYLELGSLYFARVDSFGIGCCDEAYGISINASNWINGGLSGIRIKDGNGNGADIYTSLMDERFRSDEGGGKPISSFLRGNFCNFEEALESQRFVDALVKSNLTDKVDGATVLEYDTNGNIIVPNGVDVASGTGMKEGKKYYVIRDVPNCQGIGDGVMTYVLNVFVKTTFNSGVTYYYNDTFINVGGKEVIFKFSYPTYRGLELFSGAQTQIEGINYVTRIYENVHKNSIWYAKDYTDIKYNPNNFESSHDEATGKYTDAEVPIDENIPYIKGFVNGGEYTGYGGWVKTADYDVSLYCATECSDELNAINTKTHECGYSSIGRFVDSGYKRVFASLVGCMANDTLFGRTFECSEGVDYRNGSFAGGFSIGNPTL